MTTTLSASTLPENDNINPYAFCYDLDGEFFIQRGRMIAFYGSMRFEPVTATSVAGLVATRFSSPLYTRSWAVATGRGKLVLGDRGHDINSYDLEDGNLTIRAANLLGFEPTLTLKQSIVPGFVTLIGTGKFLASSLGPVVFVEPPFRCDPDALVGWADTPAPSHHYDAGWMGGFLSGALAMMGRASGEERQFDFTGTGTILLQSVEGAVDDEAATAQVVAGLDGLGLNGVATVVARGQARIEESRQQ